MYPLDVDYSCRSSRLGNKQVCREVMVYNSGLQKSVKTNQFLFDFLFTPSLNSGGYSDACSWFSVNKFQLNNKIL
ncbi:hypothetical protein FW781_18555 [Chryseobacterium panacisoli]|uniref:Uncharacterized protein n=1 Tax=Chryseobacterium panacisoli TaxID=1807141 RepID=A0A5D8ZLT6_9FLAO|nr:hypothetical protein [Chryseobacterium panacisoli]TZF93694.1 hypothetical protein FW781_18555 [Chryseobacterium panacisoli]